MNDRRKGVLMPFELVLHRHISHKNEFVKIYFDTQKQHKKIKTLHIPQFQKKL